MKVVVLGGRGHIGSVIFDRVSRVPGLSVTRAHRNPKNDEDLDFDLTHRDSWQRLREFDAWINCIDTHRTPADDLYEFALEQPCVLLETTAETDAYRRIDAVAAKCADSHSSMLGTLVAGVGVFPGLSHLLVAHGLGLFSPASPPSQQALTLELRWSILSEAGGGTCEVMSRALTTPRWVTIGGVPQELPPLGGPILTHLPGTPWGLELGLPEAYSLPTSLDLHSCRTIAAVRPPSPWLLLSLSVQLARFGFFRIPGVAPLLGALFRLVRGKFLHGRTTPLTMQVRDETQGVRLDCDDAFAAAGIMVGSLLSLLADQPPTRGVVAVHELTTLPALLQRAEELQFDGLQLHPPESLAPTG